MPVPRRSTGATADPIINLAHTIESRARAVNRELSYREKMGIGQFDNYAMASGDIVALRDLGLRLDNTPLNSPLPTEEQFEIRREFREKYGSSVRDHLSRVFVGGKSPLEPAALLPHHQAVLDDLRKGTTTSRLNALRVRIMHEAALREHDRWFPVFNSLTVRDECLYDRTEQDKDTGEDVVIPGVFSKGSRCFVNYCRQITRAVNAKLYSDRDDWTTRYRILRDELGNHSYFGVVEEGGKHGRLHIHVLHWLRVLPDDFVDPNRRLSVPYRREIQKMKPMWPYGTSCPIAVRYDGMTDTYANAGWAWPVKRGKGNAVTSVVARAPGAIAEYLTKYITKSYCTPVADRIHSQRTRMSQDFGLGIHARVVDEMSPSVLIHFGCRVVSSNHLVHPDNPRYRLLPRYIRQLALRRLIKIWPDVVASNPIYANFPSPRDYFISLPRSQNMVHKLNKGELSEPVPDWTGYSALSTEEYFEKAVSETSAIIKSVCLKHDIDITCLDRRLTGTGRIL